MTTPIIEDLSVEPLLCRYTFLINEMHKFAEQCTLGHEDAHGVGGLVKLVSHLRGDLQSLETLVAKSKTDKSLQGMRLTS